MWAALQSFFGFTDGDGNSTAYLFWSGIGADLAELAIIGGLITIVRQHNCQVHHCWRLGRHDYYEPGTGVRRALCWRHHPDVKHRQLTRERLHLYAGQRPGKG